MGSRGGTIEHAGREKREGAALDPAEPDRAEVDQGELDQGWLDGAAVAPVSREGLLLDAVRRGDAAAYGELFELHRDSVRRLARRLCRDHHEADDVVSEVFCNTLTAIHRGRGPHDECRAYLLRSVRHTVHKVRTRKDTGRAVPTSHDRLDAPGIDGDPADGFLDGPAIEALGEVPERFRRVLWSVEVEGFGTTDVADAERIATPAAASLVYRARRALRRSFVRGAARSPIVDAACSPIRALLPAHLDGESTAATTRRIDDHLAGCAACDRALGEMRAAHAALGARGWLTLVPAFVRGVATDVIHGGAAIGTSLAAAATIGAASLVITAEPVPAIDDPPAEHHDAADATSSPHEITSAPTGLPPPTGSMDGDPAGSRSAPPPGGPAIDSPADVPPAPGESVAPPDADVPGDRHAGRTTPAPQSEPVPSDAAGPVAGGTPVNPAPLPTLPAIVHDVQTGVTPIIDGVVDPTVETVGGVVTPTLAAVDEVVSDVVDSAAGDDGLIDTLAGDVAVIDRTTDIVDDALGGTLDSTLGGLNETLDGVLGGAIGGLGAPP